MRRLLPSPVAEDVDEDGAYWVDDPGRQHVRANMVASADGAAQAAGRSRGLSGPADERLFGLLRDHADVLLVGATTARVERYGGHRTSPARAAWRRERGLADVPPIAVVTRSLALDPDGPLFTDTAVPPIVLAPRQAPPDRVAALADRAEVLLVGEADVDLPAALDLLADRGLRRVSCEGGPALLAGLVRAGRLDELCLTVSPRLFAGPATRVLDGPLLDPPVPLEPLLLLEDNGFLFLRYRVLSAAPPP